MPRYLLNSLLTKKFAFDKKNANFESPELQTVEFPKRQNPIKAPLFKNVDNLSEAVVIQDLKAPYFDPNWHFHPHYQLFTVFEGTGTRLIGDSIQAFSPGDTVFLGPDVPHLWRCAPQYFQNNSDLSTHGIVVYFQKDFLGNDLFQLPEMYPISHFLQESVRGYTVTDPFREKIRSDLTALLNLTGFDRILHLLKVLNELALTPCKSPITSFGYRNNHKISETERMQKVHTYVLQHFKDNIRLKDVAEHAGMSEAAFCRYFKARTRKTLTDLINEIRIGHACRLLIDESQSISQIAYETGYDTLSNFNRNFKKITGKSPSNYRSDYMLPTG